MQTSLNLEQTNSEQKEEENNKSNGFVRWYSFVTMVLCLLHQEAKFSHYYDLPLSWFHSTIRG